MAQSIPASAATAETSKPTAITSPSDPSSPRLPAAAIGPGVGGTKVWVAYRPVASATLMATTETFIRAARAFFSELRMT